PAARMLLYADAHYTTSPVVGSRRFARRAVPARAENASRLRSLDVDDVQIFVLASVALDLLARQISSRGDGLPKPASGRPMLREGIEQLTVVQYLLFHEKLAKANGPKCVIGHSVFTLSVP